MEKSIIFDAGPIISLAMNDLLIVLEPLKKRFGGRFLIPAFVKRELVDRPLQSKKFKFEAMRVLSLINKGVLEVIGEEKVSAMTKQLMDLANTSFSTKGGFMQIVHNGEMQALAAAVLMGSSAFVVDERTTRMLMESPDRLQDLMEHKLHTKISINRKNLGQFRKQTNSIKLIRSTELAIVAYDMGLLDTYLPSMQNPEKELLDGVLWGIKLNGCSISEREIETIIKVEGKDRR